MTLVETDSRVDQGFIAFFRSLPEVSDGTIRLFERDRGEYYSAHGRDALYIAQKVYKTTSILRNLGSLTGRPSPLDKANSSSGLEACGPLPSCTLSKLQAEWFIKDALVGRRLKMEVWGPSPGGNSTWQILRRGSPGNLLEFEDLLFLHSDFSDVPVVVAISLVSSQVVSNQKWVGVGFADATTRVLGCCEFLDNDLFTTLEALLIQLNAKECLLPDEKSVEVDRIRVLVEEMEMVMTPCKRNEFHQRTLDIERDIRRLLQPHLAPAAIQACTDRTHAVSALGCVLNYLGLNGGVDEKEYGQYEWRDHDLGRYMRLDASALKALSIFGKGIVGIATLKSNVRYGQPESTAASRSTRTPVHTGTNMTGGLYSVLNKCRTAQGSRRLAEWLTQPLLDMEAIQQRHDLVDIFLREPCLRQAVHQEHMNRVPDLSRLSKKFQRGRASLQDVVRVYQVALRLPALIALLEQHVLCGRAEQFDKEGISVKSQGGSGSPCTLHEQLFVPERAFAVFEHRFVTPLRQQSRDLENYQQLVETTIDFDRLDLHEYRIRATFDQELQAWQAEMDEILDQMPHELEMVAHHLGLEPFKKVKLDRHSLYGHVLRISRLDAGRLRDSHDDSSTISLSKARTTATPITKKVHNSRWRTSKEEEEEEEFHDNSNENEEEEEEIRTKQTRENNQEGKHGGKGASSWKPSNRPFSSSSSSHTSYIELATQKNGVYFTTSKLRQLNTDYQRLHSRYVAKQTTVIQEVLRVITTYCGLFHQLNHVLAELDVLVALAESAATAPIPYVRPYMYPLGSGQMTLRTSRHPCLERVMNGSMSLSGGSSKPFPNSPLHDQPLQGELVHEASAFIPNDIVLSRENGLLQIITGPNMGGKSTYIRQFAMIVLMAQMGSFVPTASPAHITICDRILTRVGANDSPLRGVSTFMAEMLETSAILQTATENSLLIVDELGRGTSTYDGFGLAWAIAEHISTRIGCFCLFATHFHELTAMANAVPGVCNLQVVAHVDKDNITLLYKVLPGASDQSFGIHVAEMAHFPFTVIETAKSKSMKYAQEEVDLTRMGNPPMHSAFALSTETIHALEKFVNEIQNTCSTDAWLSLRGATKETICQFLRDRLSTDSHELQGKMQEFPQLSTVLVSSMDGIDHHSL